MLFFKKKNLRLIGFREKRVKGCYRRERQSAKAR